MGTEKPKFKASIYRTRIRSLILNVGFYLGVFLFLGIPILRILNDFQNSFSGTADVLKTFLLAQFTFLFAMISLFLVLIPYSIVRYILTYIKIGQTEIEYRHWPFHRRKVKWIDTIEIGKHKVLDVISREVLFAKNAQDLSWHLWQRLRSNQKISKMIPLAGFNGWPDGPLANDIKKYAPHLFSSETE